MGPSGAGKTSLLDLLAGRKTSGLIKGQLLINGAPAVGRDYMRRTAYVPQVIHPAAVGVPSHKHACGHPPRACFLHAESGLSGLNLSQLLTESGGQHLPPSTLNPLSHCPHTHPIHTQDDNFVPTMTAGEVLAFDAAVSLPAAEPAQREARIQQALAAVGLLAQRSTLVSSVHVWHAEPLLCSWHVTSMTAGRFAAKQPTASTPVPPPSSTKHQHRAPSPRQRWAERWRAVCCCEASVAASASG